jgi:hypothetical protein
MNVWVGQQQSGWRPPPLLIKPWVLALALSTIVAAAAIADGAHGASGNRGAALASQDQAAVAADAPSVDAQATTGPRLWIKENQEFVPFENDQVLTLPDLSVAIAVSPYPPARTATVDFYLTQNDTPVEGATVSLKYDNTLMEHGPFELLATPRGPGHYVAPLEFAMTGDYWVNVAVDRDGSESLVHLIVRAVR